MRTALVLALLAVPALAQQQPMPFNERIGAQIGALVIQNASLQAQIEALQYSLKAAQDRVKAMEDKYEPKEPPK